MKTWITGGYIYRLDKKRMERKDMCIEDGKISGFFSPWEGTRDGEIYDAKGKYVVPGFIDLHTHGGCGIDVNAASKEDFQKIGYIGEQNNEVRYTAFKESLEKLGLPFLQKNTANVKLSYEGGYQGALHLMNAKSDITAIFCANDNTAIGVIKALRERGYRIPEDISVIGVDDIETAQYLSPMLTTVHIPTEDIGRVVAKILIDRINGGHKLPMKIVLPFYIAKRDTCAPPSKHRKTFTTPDSPT